MSKNAILTLLGGLVLIAVVAWVAGLGGRTNVAPVASTNDATLRAHIAEFGTKLQLVSLLAPADDLRASMQTHYAAYIAPELLAQWQADPTQALGRRTSSPWPDHIDVVSIEQIGEGAVYRVEANIIEVANDSAMGTQPFAVQPVSFSVESLNGRFFIVAVEKGSYSQLPQRQSVVGFWECLPKKGTGPHTDECAFGIAKDQSDGHLAVDTNLMSTIPDFTVGDKVRVEGVVTPVMALSSDRWQSYDIDGIISATTIQKVE